MTNPTPTTHAPTPAEIISVMMDDEMRGRAETWILLHDALDQARIGFGITIDEMERGPFCQCKWGIPDPDLRLAVRVMRHLKEQRTHA